MRFKVQSRRRYRLFSYFLGFPAFIGVYFGYYRWTLTLTPRIQPFSRNARSRGRASSLIAPATIPLLSPRMSFCYERPGLGRPSPLLLLCWELLAPLPSPLLVSWIIGLPSQPRRLQATTLYLLWWLGSVQLFWTTRSRALHDGMIETKLNRSQTWLHVILALRHSLYT